MNNDLQNIRKLITHYDLRVTPQRIAVLEALRQFKSHPTADEIINHLRQKYPNMAIGTVYNTLDTFTRKGIIKKVKTDKDVMRYDAFTDKHYHLYSKETDRIEDYYDQELTRMIENYFKNKAIKNFQIEEVQIQINGKFLDYHKKQK